MPGCGYGRNSLFLAQKGLDVVAFDISDNAIEYAEEQSKKQSLVNIQYKVSSLFDPKFIEGKQFDGIFLSNIIHLFLRSEKRKRSVRYNDFFVKPNGILTFSVVSISDEGNYGQGEEVEKNTFMKHEDKLLHCYDEQELHEILEQNYEILEKCLHTQ